MMSIVDFSHMLMQFMHHVLVLNCRRNVIFLLIEHLANNVPQILSRTSLR